MKTKVKTPKVIIKNGMKFIREGKYYTFSGFVKTFDNFHTYSGKQK